MPNDHQDFNPPEPFNAATLVIPQPPANANVNAAHNNDQQQQTTNTSINTGTHTSTQKVIKARKSFSLKEKISNVMAYKKYCLDNDNDNNNSDMNNASGNASGNGNNAQENDNVKKTKLKSWLLLKNERDGTSIAYGTMYKWEKRYGNMENNDSVAQSSVGNLKKLRTRPFQGEFMFMFMFMFIHACMTCTKFYRCSISHCNGVHALIICSTVRQNWKVYSCNI